MRTGIDGLSKLLLNPLGPSIKTRKQKISRTETTDYTNKLIRLIIQKITDYTPIKQAWI